MLPSLCRHWDMGTAPIQEMLAPEFWVLLRGLGDVRRLQQAGGARRKCGQVDFTLQRQLHRRQNGSEVGVEPTNITRELPPGGERRDPKQRRCQCFRLTEMILICTLVAQAVRRPMQQSLVYRKPVGRRRDMASSSTVFYLLVPSSPGAGLPLWSMIAARGDTCTITNGKGGSL